MFQLNSKLYSYLAILAVIFGLTLAFTSVLDDAPVVDEIPHIGAGYSYIAKQDMRLNPEHPPLAKDLAGLSLAFLNLNQAAFESKPWKEDINGQWEFGRYFIFNSGNNANKIALVAKLPMFLFYIFSALIIFIWTRRLYGSAAALTAAILFTLSPTVMAHTRFVTTDVPALFGILIGTYYFIRYLENQDRPHMLSAAIAFGLALLAKFSTFLLIPYLGLLAVIWGFVRGGSMPDRFSLAFKNGLKSVGVFALGFIIIVWPVYYLHTMNYPPDRQYNDTRQILSSFGNRYLADPVIWASDKPILRATAQYGLGFLMVVQRSAGGNTTFFLGTVERFGWHHYFPIVYLLKEPLAWWALVAIALLAVKIRMRSAVYKITRLGPWIKSHFHEFAMLVWLAVYWITSIQSTLNIGVRHLLPTYPFAIMLVAGQLNFLVQWIRRVRPESYKHLAIVITLLLGWYALENVNVYPYYLTYFNQFAGGPSGGYRYVVDSNLDWGQDLKRFSQWVKDKDIKRIEFDYFGWSDPAYYLKDRYVWLSSNKYTDAEDFKQRNMTDGWLAVSATFLQGSGGPIDMPNRVNYNTWLKSFTPVTVIGNSIFVYQIK